MEGFLIISKTVLFDLLSECVAVDAQYFCSLYLISTNAAEYLDKQGLFHFGHDQIIDIIWVERSNLIEESRDFELNDILDRILIESGDEVSIVDVYPSSGQRR
jgi:hypothetical protein